MAAIYEYACFEGHEFQVWSDEARLCPQCGSEFLKRIFKSAPMVNTPKTKFLDNLIRNELENRGITNIQGGGQEGEKEKVTYKTTPEQLAADKIERDFPQMKDKQSIQQLNQAVTQKWSNIGVKGVIKSGLAQIPEHQQVKAAIANVGRHDRSLVNRVIRKDPENLQVKR